MAKPTDIAERHDAQFLPPLITPPVEASGNIDLAIANEVEAKQLNLNPDTVRAIGRAVSDLLGQLPQDQGDEEINFRAAFTGKPKESRNALIVPSNLPALPGVNAIRWRQLKQMPGYHMRPIRNMGNDIFMAFPCFRDSAEQAKAKGFDGHGEVLTISDFTHDRATVEKVARLITEEGTQFDNAQLDYGNMPPVIVPALHFS